MRSKSRVSFFLNSEKEALDLYSVLNPEIKSDSRVQTTLSRDGTTVNLTIVAIDRNAFRSAVNSYARWIRLYEEIGGIK
jgi:tRNA threonylcarbamoyladenosine modification (KEOPS) complex  Pcc1 subunit